MTSIAAGDPAPQLWGDRYQALEQLGSKAGRQTWLAVDLQTQQQVVVKLLSFSPGFEWADLRLFEREAEVLRSLDHPAIPRYLDFFEIESATVKGFALVQTYIAARSLAQHLQAGRSFAEAEVRQIAQALLEILVYLHDRQPPVIHRDIKPSNVLLGDRTGNHPGTVYLVDFGSVQTLAAQEGSTVTIVGTYGYMPPEQFGGRTCPASDLYSLGATLLYLVTGTHPADLPQDEDGIDFAAVNLLSPAMTAWLQRMVAPNLKRRFGSATAALQALKQPQTLTSLPLAIHKPANSRIRMQKTAECLEVLLPPRGFSLKTAFLLMFGIGWFGAIAAATQAVIAELTLATIPLAASLLPFWGAGLLLVREVLADLFEQRQVRLEPQKILRQRQIWGIQFKTRQIPRHSVDKLELCYYHDRLVKLQLWAGLYPILLSDRLTEPELIWLAQEFSDWLGLPVQQRQLPDRVQVDRPDGKTSD